MYGNSSAGGMLTAGVIDHVISAKPKPSPVASPSLPACPKGDLILIGTDGKASCIRNFNPNPPKPKPAPPRPEPARYAVRPGDTLWGIARTHCGSPLDWRSLWHANPVRDPNLIYPREVIRLAC